MNACAALALMALSPWPTTTTKAKRRPLPFRKWQKALAWPFVLVPAEELWPHLPKGGSIDDLTAEELAGAAEKIEKAAAMLY